jgi:hypothetical protein
MGLYYQGKRIKIILLKYHSKIVCDKEAPDGAPIFSYFFYKQGAPMEPIARFVLFSFYKQGAPMEPVVSFANSINSFRSILFIE